MSVKFTVKEGFWKVKKFNFNEQNTDYSARAW